MVWVGISVIVIATSGTIYKFFQSMLGIGVIVGYLLILLVYGIYKKALRDYNGY